MIVNSKENMMNQVYKIINKDKINMMITKVKKLNMMMKSN